MGDLTIIVIWEIATIAWKGDGEGEREGIVVDELRVQGWLWV